METLVARVVHSDIATWLAKIKPGKRASTYNRWRLFARQLFELAEADGAVQKRKAPTGRTSANGR